MARPRDLQHVGVPDPAVQVRHGDPDGDAGGGNMPSELCIDYVRGVGPWGDIGFGTPPFSKRCVGGKNIVNHPQIDPHQVHQAALRFAPTMLRSYEQ